MFGFYDIDTDYIKFLKTIDKQVPNIKYESNNKFLCGIVLSINNIDYYAPISHMTNKQQTNLQIFDKERPISTIRFSFMIPAFDSVLIKKDFGDIAKLDKNYADLLATEFKYCKNNQKEITRKANAVYKIGCNKNHKLNYTCCNFQELENHYMDYTILKK